MAHPVVHWEITAKDAGKMQEFYGKLFDWKIDANNPMNYGMVEKAVRAVLAAAFAKLRVRCHRM